MDGLVVGLKNIHYALLEQDDKTGVLYDDPVLIAGAVSAKISPKTSTEKFYADDAVADIASALGEIEVELEMKALPLPVQAALLGHQLRAGVLQSKSTDVAPYVAIGFESSKSNGKSLFVWLHKGRFEVPETEGKTQEGKPNYQSAKIKGTFMPREYDKSWRLIGDSDDPTFTLADTWFDAVQELPAAPAAP